MKISEIFSAMFPKVRKAQAPKPSNVERTNSKLLKRPDQVKVAKEARFISNLRTEMMKSDASREEKVREIERRIEDGKYEINSHDITRKILGE